MGHSGTVRDNKERVIVVAGHTCQEIFLTTIPKSSVLKSLHQRVERITGHRNGRAYQPPDGLPDLLILKISADHERMRSFWK